MTTSATEHDAEPWRIGQKIGWQCITCGIDRFVGLGDGFIPEAEAQVQRHVEGKDNPSTPITRSEVRDFTARLLRQCRGDQQASDVASYLEELATNYMEAR